MISLLVPSEERDFNQNSVGGGGLTCPTVGIAATRPRSHHTALLAAHQDGKLSPNNNNNTCRAASLPAEPLDNRRPAAALSVTRDPAGDLRLADDSSSDDAASGCGSVAAPPVEDTSDEAMSPAERRPGSPVRRQQRRASSLAPHSARSGKLKRSVP